MNDHDKKPELSIPSPLATADFGAAVPQDAHRAPAGTVRMKVTDPFGIAFLDAGGHQWSHERGDIVDVPTAEARRLFREGKAVPAEEGQRQPGEAPGVERR